MPNRSTARSEKGTAKSKVASRNSVHAGTAHKEDRHSMIATGAYYRAEQRGFNGGNEVQDWLEAELDAMLKDEGLNVH